MQEKAKASLNDGSGSTETKAEPSPVSQVSYEDRMKKVRETRALSTQEPTRE